MPTTPLTIHPIKMLGDTWEFAKRPNTLVPLAIIIINTLNIFLNHANPVVLPVTILLVVVYMRLYQAPLHDKGILLFVYLAFSILTLCGESVVIWFTQGKALRYGKPTAGGNVPVWLFSAYFNMVLTIYLLREYGEWMYQRREERLE